MIKELYDSINDYQSNMYESTNKIHKLVENIKDIMNNINEDTNNIEILNSIYENAVACVVYNIEYNNRAENILETIKNYEKLSLEIIAERQKETESLNEELKSERVANEKLRTELKSIALEIVEYTKKIASQELELAKLRLNNSKENTKVHLDEKNILKNSLENSLEVINNKSVEDNKAIGELKTLILGMEEKLDTSLKILDDNCKQIAVSKNMKNRRYDERKVVGEEALAFKSDISNEWIKDMYGSGKTCKEISELSGNKLTHYGVRNRLKKLGVYNVNRDRRKYYGEQEH